MLKVEVYVDGTRLDLFKDENIQITDTIQNIKDPGSIFTTFSQTFTVPASKTNNKVFQHYYNSRVVNDEGLGFDARFSVDAIIKVNGADYKTGTIRLQSTNLKLNKAYSYTVSFVGSGALLRDSILEDDLSQLTDLTQYNHDYDLATAKTGLQHGLGLSGSTMTQANGTTIDRSVIYPFISHTKRYVYDSTLTYVTYNPAVTAGTEGLEYTQLKPAIKLIHIIEAIEEKYGVTFTSDFFGDAAFDELYMWMNRTKGHIEGVDDNISYFYSEDLTDDDGADDQIFSTYSNGNFYARSFETPTYDLDYDLDFTVTPTGSGTYDIVIYNQWNDVVHYQSAGHTGTQTFNVIIDHPISDGFYQYQPAVQITSEGTITQLIVTIDGEKYVNGASVQQGDYTYPTVVPNNEINFPSVIPKMKVMDFLKGIFKMFNLTHYKQSDGEIYVDTLDNFYALGTNLDISEYIDVSTHSSDVSVPFDYIGFKYTEPETFLAKNRFEITGEVFGDEEYSLGKLFGGSKYEIETGFSHIMMEHLPDLNTGDIDSNNLFGWAVDEDEAAIADKPLILYRRGTQTLADIEWSDGTVITSYQSLGNTNGVTAGAVTNTLNFGTEIDEFTLGEQDESLYKNYYENYIAEVYGSQARLVRYTAYLPASFILNYNMYDKLIVNGVKHKINSITIDMLDGRADLELITEA